MKKLLLLLISIISINAISHAQTNGLSNSSSPALYVNNNMWTEDPTALVPQRPKSEDEPQQEEKSLITAHCYCVVSYADLTGAESRSDVCLDLTGTVNTDYHGINAQNQANRNDCNVRCTNAAANLTAAQIQAIADCACNAGAGNGTLIRAFSAVGTKAYITSQQLGHLVHIPSVSTTTCKCPTGWAANQTNVDGGVTADGKCKKAVCGPISVPTPSGYTSVGTWGFIGGSTLYAWGSSANGGAAICNTVVTPGICKIVNP